MIEVGNPIAFRVPNFLSLSRLLFAAILVLVCICSNGCGRPGESYPSSPDAVAVAYMKALFSAKHAAAERFAIPSQRSTIAVFAAILAQRQTFIRALESHTVSNDGQRAAVVITGAFCTDSPALDPNSGQRCRRNDDPKSEDPAYRIYVKRLDGRWYVYSPTA